MGCRCKAASFKKVSPTVSYFRPSEHVPVFSIGSSHRTAKTAKKQKNRAAEIEQSEIKHQSSVRGVEEEEGAGGQMLRYTGPAEAAEVAFTTLLIS